MNSYPTTPSHYELPRKAECYVPVPYGGVLDSPVVYVHHPTLEGAPITPPRTADLRSLSLPLDTLGSIPGADQPTTGFLSPISPQWPTIHDGPDVPMAGFDSHSWMEDVVDSRSEATEDDAEMLVDEDEPYDWRSTLSYSPPPELDEDDGFSPTSPLSPSLDDFSDLAPCSPSLRLTTSLPEPQRIGLNLFSHSLFSLPGAEVDDELIPTDLCLSKFSDLEDNDATSSSTPTPNNLLLGQSTISIPIPTTPAQDQLDIDVDRLDLVPDLRRLAILRKKSQEMETRLKDMEEQMLQLGEVQARADVRRERKRFKERSREITAMLKLKLGDDIFSRDGQAIAPMGKKSITTMNHLVSRMVFKRRERNELPRPIATASRSPLEKTYVPSHLSRSQLSAHISAMDLN